MSKYKKYQELFGCLLDKIPSIEMIKNYFETEEIGYNLQDFCVDHNKVEWNTGIGTIDAVQCMYEEAISNGNIKDNGEDNDD